MEVLVNGILLDVVSSDWEFNGQTGVSHKLHIYGDGVLYKVGIDSEDLSFYREQINSPVQLTCTLFVKGTYNLKVK